MPALTPIVRNSLTQTLEKIYTTGASSDNPAVNPGFGMGASKVGSPSYKADPAYLGSTYQGGFAVNEQVGVTQFKDAALNYSTNVLSVNTTKYTDLV